MSTTLPIYDIIDSSLRILTNLHPDAGRFNAKAINESGDVIDWGDRNDRSIVQTREFVHIYGDNASDILADQGINRRRLSDWEQLDTAWGINDHGWIAGVGERRFD